MIVMRRLYAKWRQNVTRPIPPGFGCYGTECNMTNQFIIGFGYQVDRFGIRFLTQEIDRQ